MKAAFTKKDLVVALACVLFLLANIAAIGGGGRKRAREAACLSNLFQWGTCFQMYTNDYDGFFPMGTTSGQRADRSWIYILQPYYRQGKLRLCPMATKPQPYPNRRFHPAYRPALTFEAHGPLWSQAPAKAWRTFDEDWPEPTFPYIDAGEYVSYLANDWVRNDPRSKSDGGAGPRYDKWVRCANVKGADKIPLMLDGKAHYVGEPSEGSPPPSYRDEHASFGSMTSFCIDRHNGAINAAFVDFSARKVGLKELWALKWNLKWDECGPWTTCGGVSPENWPEWMRDLKDY